MLIPFTQAQWRAILHGASDSLLKRLGTKVRCLFRAKVLCFVEWQKLTEADFC
jgi:hypothetical protein